MTDAKHCFPRRHFGRRKGPKLSAYRAGLVETLLQRLVFVPEKGRDPKIYFDRPIGEVWLEVGFGAGEHLAAQAEAHPEAGLIGAEPYLAGLATLLAMVDRRRITNIRLYTDDAADVIAALPDACLGRVFLLFPDPWPKVRHHKRRFLQTETLDVLARAMTPGAELRFATDHTGYRDWVLERVTAHPDFVWTARRPADWRARPADWFETRYEKKALRQGRRCAYIAVRRR